MSRVHLAKLLAVIGIGTLASCADAETPTAPGRDVVLAPSEAGVPSGSVYQNGITGPLATLAAEQSGDFACQGGEQVLLIQDVVPWFAHPDQHPLGANVTELLAQGKQFCMINAQDIETTYLRAFPEILISSAQTQQFYDNLFPGGLVHWAISDYVEQGGILLANLFDLASGPGARGSWVNYVFVAGVAHVFAPTDFTDISDPIHSVIVGGLPCLSENCAPIVDGPGSQDDLDGWFVDAIGSFTNLPEGTTVIIQDEETGAPVMVEYPFGAGTVIANLTASEWRYTGAGLFAPNKKLLANGIAYLDCLGNHLTGPDGQCLCRPQGQGQLS